jgi:hypothetical protein
LNELPVDREESGSGAGSPEKLESLEAGDGRGPSRRMNELSASEIMHIGGNKDQTTMDDNFD